MLSNLEANMLGRYCFLVFCLIILSMASQSFAEIKVAILDSGCNIEYAEGISFVDETLEDLNGHGTSVARKSIPVQNSTLPKYLERMDVILVQIRL